MTKLLDSHARMKDRFVRSTETSFMNKKVWKAIMARTVFLNEFRKDRSNEKCNAYKKTAKALCEIPQSSKGKLLKQS